MLRMVTWSTLEREHLLAEQHERVAERVEQVRVGLDEGRGAEDQTVDEAAARYPQRRELALAREARRLDEHLEPVPAGGREDLVGELTEVRLPELGDGETDDPAAAGPEDLRGHVDLVPEGVDGREHAFPGRRRGRGGSR